MPDLASLTPREQFDRLYNRVMQAAEGGDANTVTTFMPMALMAYQQLSDSVRDADARYHAAMLKLHSDDAAGALALADTILTENPKHLFGYVIRGNAAKWQQDQGALSSAYREFLQHYDAEVDAKRPEYGHHQTLLDGFRQEAGAAGG